MPGLMSDPREVRPEQAAQGRARDRLAAHDHRDGGADRDAGRAGRVGALGELQHLHARRTRPRRRSPRRASRSSPSRAKALEEYWDFTLAALTHPGRQRPATDRGRRRRRHAAAPQGLRNGTRQRLGRTRPASSHEEQVIKNLLLKCCGEERPGCWHEVVKDWKGVCEETTTGVHRLYQMQQQSCSCRPSTSTTRSPSPSSTTSTAAANRWPTA